MTTLHDSQSNRFAPDRATFYVSGGILTVWIAAIVYIVAM